MATANESFVLYQYYKHYDKCTEKSHYVYYANINESRKIDPEDPIRLDLDCEGNTPCKFEINDKDLKKDYINCKNMLLAGLFTSVPLRVKKVLINRNDQALLNYHPQAIQLVDYIKGFNYDKSNEHNNGDTSGFKCGCLGELCDEEHKGLNQTHKPGECTESVSLKKEDLKAYRGKGPYVHAIYHTADTKIYFRPANIVLLCKDCASLQIERYILPSSILDLLKTFRTNAPN